MGQLSIKQLQSPPKPLKREIQTSNNTNQSYQRSNQQQHLLFQSNISNYHTKTKKNPQNQFDELTTDSILIEGKRKELKTEKITRKL